MMRLLLLLVLALSVVGCNASEGPPEGETFPHWHTQQQQAAGASVWIQDGSTYATGLAGLCVLTLDFAPLNTLQRLPTVSVNGGDFEHYSTEAIAAGGLRLDVHFAQALTPNDVSRVTFEAAGAVVTPARAFALCQVAATP